MAHTSKTLVVVADDEVRLETESQSVAYATVKALRQAGTTAYVMTRADYWFAIQSREPEIVNIW